MSTGNVLRRCTVRVVTSLVLGVSIVALAGPANAQAACSGPADFGAQYLSSNWPGGFTGVPVYSNGGSGTYLSNCYDYATTPGGASIKAGMEWQCVELINRLYITKGWIKSTWSGNGDQLYYNAPRNLSKELQGSITYLAPGDVISFTGPVSGDGGHAAVVSAVNGSSIALVNQNTSSSNTISTGTLSNGSLVMNGWAGYTPIGAIHAPTNSGLGNGSFVQVSGSSQVYEIAGGAPLYVSSWSAVGGSHPVTTITQQAFNSLNPVPADGTFIRDPASGSMWEVAGGAPLYVSGCGNLNGCAGVVNIDPYAVSHLDHLNAVPSDGTFVQTTTGSLYRIAGGAPFAVSSWAVFGGQQPYVTIDQWDVDNITNPAAHLNAAPADGTVVEGLPSDSYWSFSGGLRTFSAVASGAVSVDDVGLAAFPKATCLAGQTGTPPNCQTPPSGCPAGQTGTLPNCQTPPSGCPAGQTGTPPNCQTPTPAVLRSRCVVPHLKHMTLSAAKRALHGAHCRVGRVHKPKHVPRPHVLRVASQSAVAGTQHSANYPVNLTLR